jgi:hypothetical protein
MVYVTEPETEAADGTSASTPTGARPNPGVPGVRLELAQRTAPRRLPSPLRALWTALDARSPTRELALLVANSGLGESVTVWRESRRGRRRRSRS